MTMSAATELTPPRDLQLPQSRPLFESSARKVFISYNRDSLNVVKALAEDLAESSEPWFDQELTGGQRWWDSILARIRDCDTFVFAMTPDSLESEACGREL